MKCRAVAEETANNFGGLLFSPHTGDIKSASMLCLAFVCLQNNPESCQGMSMKFLDRPLVTIATVYYPRDAMRKRGLCCHPVSVRPSVRPSRKEIVFRRSSVTQDILPSALDDIERLEYVKLLGVYIDS